MCHRQKVATVCGRTVINSVVARLVEICIAQHELKRVTTRVDVALSKASLAGDAEKFLLGEIENLGKAMECKSSSFDRTSPEIT
jgi:hypothetical protein